MIQVKNLTKTFKPNSDQAFHALKNVSFEVRKNELVILQGVSGSGKSTLLAIIASLMKPTSGEVIIDGKHVAKLPDLHASHFRASTIGFIFQAFNLLEHLNVAENISIPLIPLGYKQLEIDSKVENAMQLANINHKAQSPAKDLSGGEKQRCAIARALVNNPKIILCDEPTANLDKTNALAFIEVIKALKKKGYTILIATHDIIFENLPQIDKVIHIENGEIV